MDTKIGRWLSPDPKRVGYSPYIGMANNPIFFTDPDGGCPKWLCGGGDDVYAKGAVVENSVGTWQYLGNGEWNDLNAGWDGVSGSFLALGGFLNGSAGINALGVEKTFEMIANNLNAVQSEYGAVMNFADDIARANRSVTTASRIGRVSTVLGGALALSQFANSDQSAGDYTRLGMNALITGLTYTPEIISTIIGVGLGVGETLGTFNDMYEFADGVQAAGLGGVMSPQYIDESHHQFHFQFNE